MNCLEAIFTITSVFFLASQAKMKSAVLGTTAPKVEDYNKPEKRSGPFRLSRETLLPLVCEVASYFTADDVMNQEAFLESREVKTYDTTTIRHLRTMMHLRRLDILECCENESPHLFVRCLDNVRRRRVDYLCANNITFSSPFSPLRRPFMQDRMQQCCYKLGEHRYDCFNESSGHDAHRGNTMYSLDETDPVNDIWDYPVNSSWIEQVAKYQSTGQEGQPISLIRYSSVKNEHFRFQRRRHLSQAGRPNTSGTKRPYPNPIGRHESITNTNVNTSTFRQGSSVPAPCKKPIQKQVIANQATTGLPSVNATSWISTSGNPNRINIVEKIHQVTKQEADRNRFATMPSKSSEIEGHANVTKSPAALVGEETGVVINQRDHGRHPGAILQSYRNRDWLPDTATPSIPTTTIRDRRKEDSSRRTVPALSHDIAASIKERWWVRTSVALNMTKGNMTNAAHLGLSDILKHRSTKSARDAGSLIHSGSIQSKLWKGKRLEAGKVIPKSRKNRTKVHTRKQQSPSGVNHSPDKKSFRGYRKKRRKCKYSVLNAGDVQGGENGILETLKRIYKNDVWV